MELGNMIFGNSRGEYPVPREATFEGPWENFCETLKINWRGYSDEGCLVPDMENWNGVENHVFRIRAYDWDAECDCGADDKMEAWFKKHPHSPDCYQTELRIRLKSWEDRSGYTAAHDRAFGRNDDGPLPGMNMEAEVVEPGVTFMTFVPRRDEAMRDYDKLSKRRRRVEEKLYDELCAKHGTDRRYGAAVHCTCGRDTRGDLYWQNLGGHKDECRFVQPNFLYKPTGFRMNWYKYPFRDSYMSEEISGEQWADILKHCIDAALQSRSEPQDAASDASQVLGQHGMNPNDQTSVQEEG